MDKYDQVQHVLEGRCPECGELETHHSPYLCKRAAKEYAQSLLSVEEETAQGVQTYPLFENYEDLENIIELFLKAGEDALATGKEPPKTSYGFHPQRKLY
jgi:hypothetical protein